MDCQSKLTCHVQKAVLYKDLCTFGTMDPYFIAKLGGNNQYVSETLTNKGKYPAWNTSFTFDNMPQDANLEFSVYHNSELIGSGKESASDIFNKKNYKTEVPLILANVKSGILFITIEYTCSVQGGSSDIPASNLSTGFQFVSSPAEWKTGWVNSVMPVFFQQNSSNAYYFDLKEDLWKSLYIANPTIFPKYSRGVLLSSGSFLITGGEVDGNAVNTVHEMKDYVINAKDPMLWRRKAHSMIAVKDNVFVFGGFEDENVLDSAEKYNINDGTWTALAEMTYGRAYSTLVRYGDDLIFLVGGYNPGKYDGYLELTCIEKYDIIFNQFHEISLHLPFPVYGCLCCFWSKTTLLIMGGWSEEYQKSEFVYTLDLSDGTLTYLEPLKSKGWTVMPAYYFDGAFHMFQTGEEEIGSLPEHIVYPMQLPE